MAKQIIKENGSVEYDNLKDIRGKMDIHFSHHCGENIELLEGQHKASWRHQYSAGIVFSSQPLKPTTKLKLDLAGTGHACVGIATRDPASIKNMRRALSQDVRVAKEMNIHKRLGAVNVSLDKDDNRQCVHFQCNGERKSLDVNPDIDIWLFVYIKFGDLIAVLHSEDIASRCFHHVTGCNVYCLDIERRSIKLHVENPSAVCCLNQRLKPGHSVTITTNSKRANGRDPSRSHIKLGIIDLDPAELKSRDPESFVIDSKTVMPMRWTIVEKFSKENLDGELKLFMTNTGRLYYSHSSGVEGTHNCRLTDVTSGVSVILDLFRAEATVTNSHDAGTYECVDRDYDYVKHEDEIKGEVKLRLQMSENRKPDDRVPSDGGYLQMIDVLEGADKTEKPSSNCNLSPRLTRCGKYRKNKSPTNFQLCN